MASVRLRTKKLPDLQTKYPSSQDRGKSPSPRRNRQTKDPSSQDRGKSPSETDRRRTARVRTEARVPHHEETDRRWTARARESQGKCRRRAGPRRNRQTKLESGRAEEWSPEKINNAHNCDTLTKINVSHAKDSAD